MAYRLRLTIIFIFLFSFFCTSTAHAADFSFDYDVSYTVSEKGQTDVVQKVTVTNLSSDVYARDYTLTLVSDKVSNILAHDGTGRIEPIIKKTAGTTSIKLPFNDIVAGDGKTLSFELSYTSGDVAHRTGRVWEILIPGLESTLNVSSYLIHLSVPDSFGPAAYSTPPHTTPGLWTYDEHRGKGISVAFGEFQRFDFNLKYTLLNQNKVAQNQEITLPPDTAFQHVILRRLSPLPQQVRVDGDGNWLASYEVAPATTQDITADGTVLVYTKPLIESERLAGPIREAATKVDRYWERNEQIVRLAKELQTPENIYNYIVKNLDYNYARVVPGIERLGAATALTHPDQAVCMEFSDSFVAIARAAGIPARVNHGFAYTTNSRLQPLSLLADVLHAWPEYYDDSRSLWIPIDPTWGKTTRGVDYFHTLDFNHITFAILGESSEYPYPAGTFKTADSGKTVFVDSSAEPLTQPISDVEVVFVPGHVRSGTNAHTLIRLTNTGQTQFHATSITSTDTQLQFESLGDAISIPPLGHLDIPVTISYPIQLTGSQKRISFTIGNVKKETEISVSAVYMTPLSLLPILAIIAILGWYGYKRRKRNS